MAQKTTTDGGRTDTKRFGSEGFDATDLIEGDRIDPSLVASTMDGLGVGSHINPDAPEAQLAEATATDHNEVVHSAILVDGETGVLVRASRHDSSAAWTQKEADWKVREIGTVVTVTETNVLQDGGEFSTDDPEQGAKLWANTVLGDVANGHDGYSDELTLKGRTLTLADPYDGVRVEAEINLESEDAGQ